MWSTENADRKPINQAVLLDIYIEIVLDKLAKENIYRATFDYKNKAMLLAFIAEKMLGSEEANYSITYSKYVGFIEEYIKKVGFDYDISKIAEYFIERKIFSKNSNGFIKFTHSCFFHFFIAKRMEYNDTFRNKIFSKDSYYMYAKEIDYYTGLTRNDKNILKFIFEQFQESFHDFEEVISEVDVDKFFTKILKSQENQEYVTIAKNLDIESIKTNRPTEDIIMRFYDDRLEKAPKDIIHKKVDNFNLEKLIIIMCTVLRNSEGVEDFELKKAIYHSIIRNTVAWTIIYKEFIVRYVIKNNKMPPFVPKEENLIRFLSYLPMNIQNGINNYLGTYKLTPIILTKINADFKSKKSDVETYFSVALYWDNLGVDYQKHLIKFIRQLSNNVVQDYCLMKLVDFYCRKTKPNTPEEDLYLNMLTELVLKNEKISKRLTEKVRSKIKKEKEKFLSENKGFILEK